MASHGAHGLAALVALASDPLWLVNAERVTVAISHSAARVVGWAVHELVGRSTDELTPPEEWPRRDELRARMAAEGVLEASTPVLTRDGERRQVHYRAVLLSADGEPLVLGYVHPVGEPLEWARPELEPEEAPLVRELVHGLARAGVPQGYWLVRLAQAARHARALEELVRELQEQVTEEAEASVEPETLEPPNGLGPP